MAGGSLRSTPDAVCQGLFAEASDPADVPGLGDVAFRSRDVLFARKGDGGFFVAGGVGDADVEPALESIVRIVAGRI